MRHAPLVRAAALTAAAVLLLSGCGSDDEPRTAATTPPMATTGQAGTSTPTPTLTPTQAPPSSRPATPTKRATPTRTATSRGGGEDTGTGGVTKAPTGTVCARVKDRDVATVLGSPVTRSSFSGGCAFEQSDSDAPIATLEQTRFTSMKAAREDVTSAVEGNPEPVPVGEEAFVVTGTMFGGSEIQGGGAVRLGSQLVKVTVEQHQGLGRARVRQLVLDLLRLSARG